MDVHMEQPDLTDATAESPSDVLGPAGSDDAAVASFVRELTASNPDADPSAPDDVDEQDADESPVDEPAEEEEAADEPDEDADEAAPAPERTFAVKVDGKRIEVTEQELKSGYQRFADYTRKTQDLAAERKALEAEATAVKQAREEYGQRLAQLAQALKASEGEPDWEKLKAEDPIAFATQWADWQIKSQQRAALEREQQRVQQESEQQRQAEQQAWLAEQQRLLLERAPEWKDAAKAKAEHEQILGYAKGLGFRDEELAQVTDHRLVLLLRDAARYKQLADTVKTTPVPTRKVASPPAVAQAPSGQRKPVSDLTRQRQRLAKTGRAEDAVPIFLAAMKKK